MSKFSRKIVSVIIAGVLVTSLFTGCKKDDKGNQDTSTQAASETTTQNEQTEQTEQREKVKLRLSQYSTQNDDPNLLAQDRIKKALEEAVNAEFEYDSGADDGYFERLEVELMSGTAPDLFHNWGEQEKTGKWAKDGVIIKMSDIVSAQPDRYPILNKIFNSPEYKMYNDFYTSNPDDVYAIYALTAFTSWAGASVYNAELLKSAGFDKAPETTEDFVKYTKAVAASGKSGWWPRNDKLTRFTELDRTMFAPYDTTVEAPAGDILSGFRPAGDGTWKLMTVSDKTKEVLKIVADMYKSGALDKGIGIKDDFGAAIDEFVAGRIGAVNFGFSNSGQYGWALNEKWKVVHTDATYEDLVLGKTLIGPDGKRGKSYGTPYWMGMNWVIPESCKNPDRVLDLIEFVASDKGQELIFNGIEGIHFTKDGDQVVFNKEEWKFENEMYDRTDGRCNYPWLNYLFAGMQQQLKLETTDNWFEASMNMVDYSEQVFGNPDYKKYADEIVASYASEAFEAVPPYYTLIRFTDEENEIRTKLKEITLRYVPSFITGKMDIEKNWSKYVEEYEAAGAAQIEESLNKNIKTAEEKYNSFKK